MLTDIIDVFSRKIEGREITKTAITDDTITTIKRSLIDNGVISNLILRSDNGPQFTSVEFEHLCQVNNLYHECILVIPPNYNARIDWNEVKT